MKTKELAKHKLKNNEEEIKSIEQGKPEVIKTEEKVTPTKKRALKAEKKQANKQTKEQ